VWHAECGTRSDPSLMRCDSIGNMACNMGLLLPGHGAAGGGGGATYHAGGTCSIALEPLMREARAAWHLKDEA